MAQPKFKAVVDESLCTNCGRCIKPCNTMAHSVASKTHRYDPALCIGCATCVSACREGAITMVENPLYNEPSESFSRLVYRILPKMAVYMTRAAIHRLRSA